MDSVKVYEPLPLPSPTLHWTQERKRTLEEGQAVGEADEAATARAQAGQGWGACPLLGLGERGRSSWKKRHLSPLERGKLNWS